MKTDQPNQDNAPEQTNRLGFDNNQSVTRTSKASPLRKAATYVSLVLLGAGTVVSVNSLNVQNPIASKALLAQTVPNLGIPTRATAIASVGNTNFISDVVEQVGPAVVRINASRTVASRRPEIFNDPAFRQFFGSQVPQGPSERVERGTGSGFVLNQEGQILTNAHVIDGADKVSVTLQDGRSFEGTVLGTDSVTDIAVVKITADNLPTISLGNSDELKPGEWAIAIGNPLGLDSTVTTGIISATGRSSSQVGVPDKRVEFIQTDAAINPGNSGGPLLNASGQVIGINTAIIQGAQGLGFAIPINTAQNIANQLIAQGKVEHSYLGIQMVQLTPEIKQNINSNPSVGFQINADRGVLIARVMPNSPAERAGIRAGDVIQKINNQAIADSKDVQKFVESSKVGSNLPMELSRAGKTIDLVVQPGAVPTQQNS
ncbi:MAG: trypsin-like peptidase domain-containing protein [Kastovskya adunca ATA6-11-RM4]|jgi:Do/DeqQ family serine protease|nr:trypsin-like peptidase domain-containing protein [Kastovskya adunca ATA6-11-RM4]